MKLSSMCVCACAQMFAFVCTIHVCLLASDLIVSVVIMFVCHLQINGQDVQDREEAMAALSNEECRNIILLVARPEMQVRNYTYTDILYLPATDLSTYWVKEARNSQITALKVCHLQNICSE